MRYTSFALLSLMLLAATGRAQENAYVGVGYGSFDYGEKSIDQVLGEVSDTLGSTKLFGGFEINDHFLLEVSFGRTDHLRQSGSVVSSITDGFVVYPDATVSNRLAIDYEKTALRALGQVPLGPAYFLGGVGWFRADGNVRQRYVFSHPDLAEDIVQPGAFTVSDNGLMAILGLEWRFGRFGARYAFRLEYEWWDISNVDASTVGLGFSYGF